MKILADVRIVTTAVNIPGPVAAAMLRDHGAGRRQSGAARGRFQADAGLITPPTMPSTLIADLSRARRVVIEAVTLLYGRERSGEARDLPIAVVHE